MTSPPLANPQDVADVWRPLSDSDIEQVYSLIGKASAKLRQTCPFDIDARMALFATAPTALTALDPVIVADVVATVVKRFLVNREGVASYTDGTGPYTHSAMLVNRYDKTGSDVRGAIQIIESDINQLRPAVPAPLASTFRVRTPRPRILVPGMGHRGRYGRGYGPAVIPDYQLGDPYYIPSEADGYRAGEGLL